MKNPLQCQTREMIHQKKVVNKLHLKSRFPDLHLSHQKVLPPKIMLLQDLLSHKSRILLNTALQAAINPQALIYELTRSLFMMQSWLYHLKVEQKHFWEWKKTLETFAWLQGVAWEYLRWNGQHISWVFQGIHASQVLVMIIFLYDRSWEWGTKQKGKTFIAVWEDQGSPLVCSFVCRRNIILTGLFSMRQLLPLHSAGPWKPVAFPA